MTVIGNTKPSKIVGKFFDNLRKISADAVRKPAKKVVKTSSRALESAVNSGSAAINKNLEAALSTTPDVRKLCQFRK